MSQFNEKNIGYPVLDVCTRLCVTSYCDLCAPGVHLDEIWWHSANKKNVKSWHWRKFYYGVVEFSLVSCINVFDVFSFWSVMAPWPLNGHLQTRVCCNGKQQRDRQPMRCDFSCVATWERRKDIGFTARFESGPVHGQMSFSLAKSNYGTTSDNENGVGYPGSWNLCSWCPYRRHFDFATFVIGGSLQKSHCGVVRFLLTPSDNEMAKSNNHIMVTWRPKIYVGLQSEVVKLELSQLLK